MSRSSLRTITNINIDGQAIDAVTQSHTLTFKVNCDSLSWVQMRYYDNTDGTTMLFYYPKGGTMAAKHNGETFHGHFGMDEETGLSSFVLGHDYTTVPIVYQNYPESTEHPENTGPGKYDVLLGSGRIQEAVSGRSVYIGKDITSILSPNRFENRLIGGCMLQIDGVQTLIESYNRSTGMAELESAVTAEAGKLFYLVSNYLVCDPFNWYCRSDPEVALTAEIADDGVKVSGSYSQAEEVAMQSYQFSYLGEQGERCFTYTFGDVFPLPAEPEDLEEEICCEVMTQENHYGKFTVNAAPPEINTEDIVISAVENKQGRNVAISLRTSFSLSGGARYFLWRKEAGGAWCLRKTAIIYGQTYIYDNTAETGKSYSYRAVLYRSGTIYYADSDAEITSRRIKISELREGSTSYHRRSFSAGDSKYFDVSGEQGEIAHSTGTQVVGTLAPQPRAVFNEQSYESGALTVYADQLGSTTEPIRSGVKRLSELEDFFSQKRPFLIVDNAGNARIVAFRSIVREYGYDSGLTRFVLEWTELCRTGDALI